MKLLFIAGVFCLGLALMPSIKITAQTDADAIMIPRNYLCIGAMYTNSSWKDYWEADFKRDNANLGSVSTRMYAIMGNYGIRKNLNFLFGLPYVTTKASQGTLKGMHGIQDLSLSLKWKAFNTHVGSRGILSVYTIGGVSMPLSNYVADYLPMSIGFRSRNVTLRGLADFQKHNFFISASANYARRSNITIDRTSYYTTEMHYTNKVDMPDVFSSQVRAGFRNKQWIAEVLADRMVTLGGFDIRKNDMPFPSNKMKATRAGVNLKYTLRSLPGLELTAGGNYVLSGRNVGQATTLNGGLFYIMNLSKNNRITLTGKKSQS